MVNREWSEVRASIDNEPVQTMAVIQIEGEDASYAPDSLTAYPNYVIDPNMPLPGPGDFSLKNPAFSWSIPIMGFTFDCMWTFSFFSNRHSFLVYLLPLRLPRKINRGVNCWGENGSPAGICKSKWVVAAEFIVFDPREKADKATRAQTKSKRFLMHIHFSSLHQRWQCRFLGPL